MSIADKTFHISLKLKKKKKNSICIASEWLLILNCNNTIMENIYIEREQYISKVHLKPRSDWTIQDSTAVICLC